MADYIKALNEGFEAARRVDIAKKEIETVLSDFRREILTGSKGRLLIELQEFEEPQDAYSKILRGAVLGTTGGKDTYWALAAANPNIQEGSFKPLARWKQARDGYPCSLTYGKQERQFEDRAALEQGLAELLKDPSIGELLYSLNIQK